MKSILSSPEKIYSRYFKSAPAGILRPVSLAARPVRQGKLYFFQSGRKKTQGITLVEILIMTGAGVVFLLLVAFLTSGTFKITDSTGEYSDLVHRINLLAEYLKSDLQALIDTFEFRNGIRLSGAGFIFYTDKEKTHYVLQKLVSLKGNEPEIQKIEYVVDRNRKTVSRKSSDRNQAVEFSSPGGELDLKLGQLSPGFFQFSIKAGKIEIHGRVFAPNLVP